MYQTFNYNYQHYDADESMTVQLYNFFVFKFINQFTFRSSLFQSSSMLTVDLMFAKNMINLFSLCLFFIS